MTEYYNWKEADAAKGQAMLDAINNHPLMPLIDPKTGEVAMEHWAKEMTEYVDGSKGFQRLPANILDMLDITTEERGLMLTTYEPDIVNAEDLPLTVQEQYAIDHPDEI